MNLNDFKKGDTVRYIGKRADIRGLHAKVIRCVKSRGVVTIDWMDPAPGTLSFGWFDAIPESLEMAGD